MSSCDRNFALGRSESGISVPGEVFRINKRLFGITELAFRGCERGRKVVIPGFRGIGCGDRVDDNRFYIPSELLRRVRVRSRNNWTVSVPANP